MVPDYFFAMNCMLIVWMGMSWGSKMLADGIWKLYVDSTSQDLQNTQAQPAASKFHPTALKKWRLSNSNEQLIEWQRATATSNTSVTA